ncbi:hypothetical protein HL658_21045 [Azospirillum sp. RWY-5-1]|uniref:Tetratricopeptide repeat protein n=1 Tax=Azospirillum oleiclasticum TaxID=2735135 RepID=A0ABX2TF24_9PROT|nr:hypothetical protein [Azospirillum oleiclasticum]NYZ15039.1 hypothetical protein [Azospirillum oleiclasticum]NYZ22801.1 hypothetical protein [Azospirillum oleiclasticum]
MTEPLPPLIRRVLALVLDSTERTPHPALPRRLTALFHRLRQDNGVLDAGETEDLIWAIWTSHSRPDLEKAMHAAIASLALRDFTTAATRFDAILDHDPDWAEAWNKRATLHFLRGNDTASLLDIEQTLSREPRHFGAIAGFAHICERNGALAEADAAAEMALRHNPHLHGLRLRLAHRARPTGRSN